MKHSTRFCGIFPSLKQNFIAYHSFKVCSRPDCIFEIHQLWQSGFSRVYSNCCYSFSFEPEIIKIGQSSHKMYTILNIQESMTIQESTTILNACTKRFWKLTEGSTYVDMQYKLIYVLPNPSAKETRIFTSFNIARYLLT